MNDTEIVIGSATELAGAEEGARELERSLGKAKALGRDCADLQGHLDRVREGMRRFREEQGERRDEGLRIEDGGLRMEGAVVEDRAAQRRDDDGTTGGWAEQRRDDAATLEGAGGEEDGVGSDGGTADGPSSDGERGLLSPALSSKGGEEDGGALAARGGEAEGEAQDSDARSEVGASQMAAEPAEAGTTNGDWDKVAFQRELEVRLLEALDELLRQQGEKRELETRRMLARNEAVEAELRRVATRLAVNRDGG